VEIAADAARAARAADSAAETFEAGRIGRSLSKTSALPSAVSAPLIAASAPTTGVALPRSFFEISALLDLRFPPDVELRAFATHAKMQVVDPSKLCEDAAWEIDPKTATLPEPFQSFMANGNLVPVPFKQSVLHVENAVRQQAEQQRSIMSQAGGLLQILPVIGLSVSAETMFFVLVVRRDQVLADTSTALRRASPEDLKKPLKVKFANEEGVDEGGVAKEYFRLLSEQLFSPDFGMFSVDSESRYLWFNPASFNDPEDFEMVGSVIGLAVYNNLPGLDVNLPPVLFKKLKDVPTTVEDLGVVFPAHALSLQAVVNWKPPDGCSEEEAGQLFQDTFCLDFSVSYEALGETRTVNLLEGEESPSPVTLPRRDEFAKLFKDWYLTTGVASAFDPFRKGFDRVCMSPVYSCLSAAELEAIICGEKDIDFAHLRKGSVVVKAAVDFRDGYLDDFWNIALSFDIVQKRQFLKFVTGSDLAPVGGLERIGLKIQRNGGEPTDRLPTSQTCFNLLLLPEYADEAKLRRLLTTAIENAEGFGLQ